MNLAQARKLKASFESREKYKINKKLFEIGRSFQELNNLKLFAFFLQAIKFAETKENLPIGVVYMPIDFLM